MSNFGDRIREYIRIKSEGLTIQDANTYYLDFGYATVINDGLAWANKLEK